MGPGYKARSVGPGYKARSKHAIIKTDNMQLAGRKMVQLAPTLFAQNIGL